MELRYLQTFRTVARLLSVTQAAAVLHYAQSSVSDHLHALEDEFGVKLFDRRGKRLVLTQSGHRLLDYADHMIRLTEEAHLAIPGGEEPAGTLVLSAPETLCSYRLPLVLQRFRQYFPQVQLSFRPNVCTHLRQMVTAWNMSTQQISRVKPSWQQCQDAVIASCLSEHWPRVMLGQRWSWNFIVLR